VLGSIDLTRVIRNPFTPDAAIDWSVLRRLVTIGVELLDRALDVSVWPLPQQAQEVQAKRRIGLGFMGLGDALMMLGHRYDSEAAREVSSSIARYMCHAAYRSSIALARQLGPFPLFDAQPFLSEPHFASTLPGDMKAEIALYGLRNSHLLAIAPTGSIALAFADNVSSGIEPVFAASCARLRRMPDGGRKPIHLIDHAVRVWQALHTETRAARLPPSFVTALQMRAGDQLKMVAAVAPFIDAGIAKTVNLPRNASVSETAQTFIGAWRAGLSGITVYRADAASPGVGTESD
jgi:ribonucleoside-diphosphate reductase alpha chain